MGGAELLEDDRPDEVKSFRSYKYVWEQKRFDPITHDCEFFIHFRFPDGSALERAFHYQWRLWTIPEIRELLVEAGFRRADVYWEDTDRRTGKGNDYLPASRAGRERRGLDLLHSRGEIIAVRPQIRTRSTRCGRGANAML